MHEYKAKNARQENACCCVCDRWINTIFILLLCEKILFIMHFIAELV